MTRTQRTTLYLQVKMKLSIAECSVVNNALVKYRKKQERLERKEVRDAKKPKPLYTGSMRTSDDVRNFFTWCVSNQGMENFTPDWRFGDVITTIDDPKYTERDHLLYSDQEADGLNEILSNAHAICGREKLDIYAIADEITEEYAHEFNVTIKPEFATGTGS